MLAGNLRRRLAGKSLAQITNASYATVRHSIRHIRSKPDPFDVKWGTDTGGIIPISKMKFSSDLAPFCVQYQASDPEQLEELTTLSGIDPADFTMIDIGSGKGRMVLSGCAMNFRHVVGVEYSADLDGIAQNNSVIFMKRNEGLKTPEFYCGDATQYDFPDGPLFLYFFNPFGPPLLGKLLDRIEEAGKREARRILFIYAYPCHIAEFDKRPEWVLKKKIKGAVILEFIPESA